MTEFGTLRGQMGGAWWVLLTFVAQCAVRRRHFSAGANPVRQLARQPVGVGADDGGNDIG